MTESEIKALEYCVPGVIYQGEKNSIFTWAIELLSNPDPVLRWSANLLGSALGAL